LYNQLKLLVAVVSFVKQAPGPEHPFAWRKRRLSGDP
jgi:hypothetical protein